MKKEISIVMATYNRSELLIKQLKAFQKQTIDPSRFQIVVVNDGSSDNTMQILHEWQFILPNLKVINQLNGGPAKARNTGVEKANSEIIAFTDDDCIVDGDWLEQILKTFKNDRELQVLHGETYSNNKEITPFTHQIQNHKWNHIIPTCNAAYKKEILLEIGGFDTNYPFPHNEDTDLAWKIHEHTQVLFEKSVRVYHPAVPVSFKSQLRRMLFLKSEFLLYSKQPDSYKKWRTNHAWLTIYLEVFFKHQFRSLKFHLGFFKRPLVMLKAIGLTISCWFYLIYLFPEYFREYKKWQKV